MDAKNEIGEGGFGTVYKVKDKTDGQDCAIKRIELKKLNKKEKSRLEKEVANLQTVRSEFVVTYYESWKDSQYFYIKMELCSVSLRNIIDRKAQVFGRHDGEPINKYEYIMSCEIFRQIVECVQYLHNLKPQIIHRDLKPENILIARNVVNKRFIKLCDFGLAKVHDNTIHYRTSKKHTGDVGDIYYMAPEVSSGAKYGHKCDIYSLVLVARHLFDINFTQKDCYVCLNDELKEPVSKLWTLMKLMLSTPEWSTRPECSEILAKYNEWSIDKENLINEINFREILFKVHQDPKSVFYKIMSTLV